PRIQLGQRFHIGSQQTGGAYALGTPTLRGSSPDYSWSAQDGACGASGEGQEAPEVQAGVMRAEVEAELGTVAVGELTDPAADLENAESQGIELEPCGLGLGDREPTAQGVQE